MTRWVVGLTLSVLYWGVGLILWGASLLADILGDCLNQPICARDKPYWRLADFAALLAMVLVYVGAIVFYRRLSNSADCICSGFGCMSRLASDSVGERQPPTLWRSLRCTHDQLIVLT